MIIYVYKKCSTCRDALKFLESRKIKCEVREITETPPTMDELKHMLEFQGGNIKKLFNTSGLLYREMGLAGKELSLELLTQHGMLVKRPFLLDKTMGLVGFKIAEWQVLLKLKN